MSAAKSVRSVLDGCCFPEGDTAFICRPFGRYVLCTSSGVALSEKPSEVLQLLVLSMQPSASPLHSSADVLREHAMARYAIAVQDVDLDAPTWTQASAFFADTRSFYELGLVRLLQVSNNKSWYHAQQATARLGPACSQVDVGT